jgi:hypothetical protein
MINATSEPKWNANYSLVMTMSNATTQNNSLVYYFAVQNTSMNNTLAGLMTMSNATTQNNSLVYYFAVQNTSMNNSVNNLFGILNNGSYLNTVDFGTLNNGTIWSWINNGTLWSQMINATSEPKWNANYSQFLLNNQSLSNYIVYTNLTTLNLLNNGSYLNTVDFGTLNNGTIWSWVNNGTLWAQMINATSEPKWNANYSLVMTMTNATTQNNSLVYYIAVVNTSMNNSVNNLFGILNNGSYLNTVDFGTLNNGTIWSWVNNGTLWSQMINATTEPKWNANYSLVMTMSNATTQNNSLVYYIAVVNTSMNNSVKNLFGILNNGSYLNTVDFGTLNNGTIWSWVNNGTLWAQMINATSEPKWNANYSLVMTMTNATTQNNSLVYYIAVINTSMNNSVKNLFGILNNGSYLNTVDFGTLNNGTIWSWVNNGTLWSQMINATTEPKWNANYSLVMTMSNATTQNDSMRNYIGVANTTLLQILNNGSYLNGASGTLSGTGTAWYVPMWNGTTSLNNSAIYQNGSNIGIGTTSPTVKLQVLGGTAAGLNEAIRVSGGAAAGNSGPSIGFHDTYAGTSYPDWKVGEIGAIYNGSNGYGGDLVFYTNDGITQAGLSEKMRITSVGNVGINTTSPEYPLDIGDFTGDETLRLASQNDGISTIRFTEIDDTYGFSLQYDGTSNTFNIFAHNIDEIGTQVLTILRENGNVGIGTTAPDTKLEVSYSDESTTTVSNGLTVLNSNGTTGNFVGMRLSTYKDATTGGAYPKQFIGAVRTDDNGYGDLIFLTKGGDYEYGVVNSSDERMRITDNGTVGIGTTAPRSALSIFNASANNRSLDLARSYTTIPIAPTTIDTGYYLQIGGEEYNNNSYRLIGIGYKESMDSYSPAYIGFQEMNDYDNTIGDLIFGTRDVSSDTSPSERMRITAAGNVGIGTTDPQQKLHVNGNVLANGTINATTDVCIQGGNCLSGLIKEWMNTSRTSLMSTSATANTLISDLNTSFVLTAYNNYSYDCKIIFMSNTTGTGMSLGMNFSGGTPDFLSYLVTIPLTDGTASGTGGHVGTGTTNADMITSPSVETVNTNYTAQISGLVGVGAASVSATPIFRAEVVRMQVSVQPRSYCRWTLLNG